MKRTENELTNLKVDLNDMWMLTISQLEKVKQAFLTSDIELSREVISREKRVDAFHLKVESDCENYIALYNPVAIDLRLVLSIIKISGALERIADFAEGIARHIIEGECDNVGRELYDDLQIEQMFDTVISMCSDCYVALDSENTKIAGKILSKDELCDEIYHQAIRQLTAFLQKQPDKAGCVLRLILLLRKMERIGDHCSNIVEEIVFFVDAKVLKHRGAVRHGMVEKIENRHKDNDNNNNEDE